MRAVRVIRMLPLVLVVGGVALPAWAQGPPPGSTPPVTTGLILGRVVDGGSGRPVGGVIVALDGLTAPAGRGGSPETQPRALTNANGQFVFRRLTKGSFFLTATKVGYADGSYGRRRPAGTNRPVELAEGERMGDVVIQVWQLGSISGTVTDEAGEPAVGVQIRSFQRRFAAGRSRYVATNSAPTDDRGMYRIGSLIPGDYIVAFVSKQVTVPAATDGMLRQPSGTNDPKYQELSRERFAIGAQSGPPGSSQAMRVGDAVLSLSSAAPVPPLPVADAPMFVYPTLYFPAAASVGQAATIPIGSGQERGNVDLNLRPVRTARVSGGVSGPDGPVGSIALRLLPAAGTDFLTELETSTTMTGPSGEFTFAGVPPGQYVVDVLRVPRPGANAPSTVTQMQIGNSTIVSSVSGNVGPQTIPADPTLYAATPVTVADRDVANVIVVLQTGARVTGRLEFDGTIDRPTPEQLRRTPIMFERPDSSAGGSSGFGPVSIPPGQADESGKFTSYGLPPGRYLVRIGGSPAGWTLRSVISDGRDISENPLELGVADAANVVVTFTDRPTTLTGSVHDASGAPNADALVVVFPTDSAGWIDFGLNPRRLRSARPAKTGAFSFTGLPAGEYYIAAISEDAVSQWQEPQFLEALARSAQTIRLDEGETHTQALKIIGGGQ